MVYGMCNKSAQCNKFAICQNVIPPLPLKEKSLWSALWYSINEKTQAYMVIIMADLKGVVSLKYAENKLDSILKRKKEGGKEINLA